MHMKAEISDPFKSIHLLWALYVCINNGRIIHHNHTHADHSSLRMTHKVSMYISLSRNGVRRHCNKTASRFHQKNYKNRGAYMWRLYALYKKIQTRVHQWIWKGALHSDELMNSRMTFKNNVRRKDEQADTVRGGISQHRRLVRETHQTPSSH